MGLFDHFKKKEEASEPEERLENVPEMLNVKLLLVETTFSKMAIL